MTDTLTVARTKVAASSARHLGTMTRLRRTTFRDSLSTGSLSWRNQKPEPCTIFKRNSRKEHIQRRKTNNTMMNKHTSIALMALLASSNAFIPAPQNNAASVRAAATSAPYFVDVNEKTEEKKTAESTESVSVEAPEPVKKVAVPKKAAAKKGAGATHKDGIFSPAVFAAKAILGDEQLNKVRAKAISMHSDVISSFVDTHEWPTGQAALKALFALADKNGDGTICENELNDALHTLGFTWLKEKQVKGIFERADTDENGAIDLEEFMKEAPKTLRTNLTKLAKNNGGELGFLV